MNRNKVLSLVFKNNSEMNLCRVLLNSNIFYWYWRSFGDGFLLGVEVVGLFPIPKVSNDKFNVLAALLDSIMDECTTFKKYRGEKIPSYNFNKRMDVLLEIDAWIVSQIAPDMDLPRDIFAQTKSNSFMRSLAIEEVV